MSSSKSKPKKVQQLAKQLRVNGQDLNPLADLIKHLLTCPLHESYIDGATIVQGHISTAIRDGRLVFNQKLDVEPAKDPKSVVQAWLRERVDEFIEALGRGMASEEEDIQRAALSIHMSLIQTYCRKHQKNFPISLWRPLYQSLIITQSHSLQKIFTNDYLDTYDDIRHHFLSDASKFMSTLSSKQECSSNALRFFEEITTMPDDPSELNAWWGFDPATIDPKSKSGKRKANWGGQEEKRAKRKLDKEGNIGSTGIFDDEADITMLSDSDEEKETQPESTGEEVKLVHSLLDLKKHRKVYTQYFYTLLGMGLDEDKTKRLLIILHSRVLPHLTHVTRLMDWLADCTNQGGTVSLLALNALYLVMSKSNLDYPNFYPRVYQLLDNKTLHSRHRTRFLNLLDIFLTSSHLTAALVAAFIKRLSRLSINAPPGAIVLILPFVYNLIKRHPKCEQMIHRPDIGERVEDPYDMSETDPLKSKAIDSSIWELISMKKHYLSSIATLTKMFEQKLTKPNYELEDFADQSYSSMFNAEVNRPLKNPPALSNWTIPGETIEEGRIFPVNNDYEQKVDQPVDIVAELWTF